MGFFILIELLHFIASLWEQMDTNNVLLNTEVLAVSRADTRGKICALFRNLTAFTALSPPNLCILCVQGFPPPGTSVFSAKGVYLTQEQWRVIKLWQPPFSFSTCIILHLIRMQPQCDYESSNRAIIRDMQNPLEESQKNKNGIRNSNVLWAVL